MKKITIVSVASFLFLFLCSVVAKLTGSLFGTGDFVLPLVIGVTILVASGIGAVFAREGIVPNVVCFFISAVAMGFIIRAWYILRGLENPIWVMTLISLACVAYLWFFFALLKIPFVRHSKAMRVIVVLLYLALSVTAYILLVAKTETNFVSTLGYYMFLELSFIFAMSITAEDIEELVRHLTLSSYSVFVVAIIVAVFIIMAALGADDCDCDCDAECCECCDGAGISSDFGSGKRKKRK